MSVVVGSSLPPQVEGQLRCFLAIKVDGLKWCIPRPPKDVQVKILWWGDASNCVLLRPIVESDPYFIGSNKCVEAHYPVRCGPKQFNAYLADMKSLLIDVVYGSSCADFAKIEVPNIYEVSASKPMFGCYPLICSTVNFKRKQVGTLCISVAFKSISDAFNMASSIIPTTDEEFEQIPIKSTKSEWKNLKAKSRASISNKQDLKSVNNPEHENKETVHFQHPPDGFPIITKNFKKSPTRGVITESILPMTPLRDEIEPVTKILKHSPVQGVPANLISGVIDELGDNILSSLLVKGQHLRDAMLKSNINSQKFRSQAEHLKNHGPDDLINEFFNSVGTGDSNNSTESLLELMEKKAVDLVIDDKIGTLLQQLSDHSDIESDEGDPLHDSSLLSDLFYTNKKDNKIDESSIVFSEDSEEDASASSLNQARKNVMRKESQKNKQTSEVLLEEPNEIQSHLINDLNLRLENLSIEQLTKLGTVESANIHIQELQLFQIHSSVIYFVEFNFPVYTYSNYAMDVVRFASRSKKGDCVSFERCLMIPVRFTEQTVNYWWNSFVHFKIFAKYRNNKLDLFGSGLLRLRDVILSKNLKSSEFSIGIFDTCTNNEKDKSVSIGNLQIVIELFSNANNSTKFLQKAEKQADVIADSCIKSGPLEKVSNLKNKFSAELFNSPPKTFLLGKKELQSLIAIYEGSVNSIECSHCNLYCVCRVYWTNYDLKTKVVWGSSNPQFDFEQIIPMQAINIVGKMENNFLFVEVWNKSADNRKDKLVGICKVSLQTLFGVFTDSGLVEIFLESQYPVVVCDNQMPVIDLISGKENGSLKLLIAVGLPVQINYLLEMQLSHLQMKAIDKKMEIVKQISDVLTHEIEITVEKVNAVFSDNKDLWGEAECYIRYNFPEQIFGEFQMSYFQSKPTLCTPTPVFRHTNRHLYSVPFNKQLQQSLLQCITNAQKSTDIIFELWRQSYYLDKKEQLICKASLGIQKIFSLFSMNSQGRPIMELFNIPVLTDEDQREVSLDLRVKYTLHQEDSDATILKDRETDVVILSVSIMRLCGLKDAVNAVFRHHKQLDQYIENGIRTYVRSHFSFLGCSSSTESSVSAASHSPTLNFQYELPLKLCAESDFSYEIENGHLICQVLTDAIEFKETIIGEARIPLTQTLTHNTGAKGWYLLELCTGEDKVVAGGIELCVKFLNPDDRETLINHSMCRGWSPKFSVQLHDESWLIPPEKRLCCFVVSINLLFLPMQAIDNVLTEKSLFYARYKFCDQGAIRSRFSRFKKSNKAIFSELNHMHKFQLKPTPTLAWYLREETLEVEFWVSNSRLKSNERNSDILIGSSYVCLEKFSHSPYQVDTVSGCFPLFRAGSSCVCCSSCSITISFNEEKSDFLRRTRTQSASNFSDLFCDHFEEIRKPVIPTNHEEISKPILAKASEKPIILIRIEEALHLPKAKYNEDVISSAIYVSYTASDQKSAFTNLMPNNENPVWKYQKQESLDLRSLKNFVLEFKMWRSLNKEPNSEKDILLGTVQVDVSPLFSGMQQLLGWYNVKDCNGQSIGQIKIGIIPSVLLSLSRSAKFFKNFNTPVSLDLTCFKNVREPIMYNANLTSKSELLNKLHKSLQDLDCITRNIRELSLVNKVSHVSKPQVHENIKDAVHDENKAKVKIIEPFKSDFSCNQYKMENNGFNVTVEKDDKNACDLDGLSSDDSTDELMNHLEEFKKKYSKLKEFTNLEFEQDWLSDDDQVKNNRNVKATEYNEYLPSVGVHCDDVVNVSAKTSPRDLNEQYDESSLLVSEKVFMAENKGHNDSSCALSCDSDELLSESISSEKSQNSSVQSDCETANDRLTKVENEFFDSYPLLNINSQVSKTSCDVQEAKKTHLGIPNFFMKPDEMAESMKALRLAAKFSHPPRVKSDDLTKIVKTDIETINERLEHSPANASEIARIAQIFSSKKV